MTQARDRPAAPACSPAGPIAPTNHAAASSTVVSAADDHHAACQSPIDLTTATSAPDRAMPAPTPPYAQPTMCGWPLVSSVRIMFPATMKMTALATPARPRRAAHAATSRVSGIAASVATRTTPLTRRARRARLSVGSMIPRTAPIRYPR